MEPEGGGPTLERMDLTASASSPSALLERARPWVPLAAAVAVPLYGLPLAFRGLRSLRPRVLRDALGGAIALGMLSLAGLGLSLALGGASRLSTPVEPSARRRGRGHWSLPRTRPFMPEDEAASALSGH